MREVHPNSAALELTAANSGGFDYNNVYEQVLRLHKENRSNRPQDKAITELNQKLHSQGIIPDIEITGTDKDGHFTGSAQGHEVKVVASDIRDVYQPGQTNSLLQSAANIGNELYNGVYDEVAHHKDRLAISAGSGLAVGFAVGLAATPAVATGLMALGLGYSGYQIYKHLPGWIRDAKVTANPQLYSHTEVVKAHAGVEGFGAGALDLGVGMVAGIAGGYAGRTVKMTLRASAAATVPDTNQAQAANQGSDGHATSTTAQNSDGHATAGAAQSSDATQASAAGQNTDTIHARTEGAEQHLNPKPDSASTAGDLRQVGDAGSFKARTDKLLAAHRSGERVEIQINTVTQLTDSNGNPMFLGADGNTVIKTTAGGAEVFTDAHGELLHLSDQQISGLKPLNQGRMLGRILAERDPGNWHPNLVKPSPGLEPAPPETHFTAVQPAKTYLSNDGAPLDLSKSVAVGDKLPIYGTNGQPLLTPEGVPVTTTEIPAGARLSYGTIFRDGKLQSVDPAGSVWAKTTDGNLIRITQAGEARPGFDASKFAVNEKGIFGQPTAGKVVIIRDGGAVLPDGQPVLDAYPSNLDTLNLNIVLRQPEGNNLGVVVSKPVVLPHYDVPEGMAIKVTMKNGGTQIATGAAVGDNKGFLWNPDSGYPNWEKVVAQTGAPRNPDGTLDVHTAELVVKLRGWATQAGNALKEYLKSQPAKSA